MITIASPPENPKKKAYMDELTGICQPLREQYQHAGHAAMGTDAHTASLMSFNGFCAQKATPVFFEGR